jgi:hypothetical protein
MKSKNIVLLAVLSLAVFSPVSAFAENSTVTTTPKPGLVRQFMENRKDVRKDLKDNRQETRQEDKKLKEGLSGTPTETRSEFRKNKMATNQNGVYNSFNIRFNALKSYQSRIQTRLDEKKVKLPTNQNLIDAQSKLDSLQGLYNTFTADLATYKVTVDSISTATDPTTLMTTLRTQAKTVSTDLNNIRQAMVAALRLVVQAK